MVEYYVLMYINGKRSVKTIPGIREGEIKVIDGEGVLNCEVL
jgi:hypothetical protein